MPLRIERRLAMATGLPPLVLYGLARSGMWPAPDTVGAQAFLIFGLVNAICIAAAVLIIDRWMKPSMRAPMYAMCGALPLPAMLVLTMGYGALADAGEMEGRMYVLQAAAVSGGLSGLIMALPGWRLGARGG